jgi:hypothetical protein
LRYISPLIISPNQALFKNFTAFSGGQIGFLQWRKGSKKSGSLSEKREKMEEKNFFGRGKESSPRKPRGFSMTKFSGGDPTSKDDQEVAVH